jgi:hypothetical protein
MVTVTYTGKETRHITKLFKNTIVKTAYRTRNTIKKIFTTKITTRTRKQIQQTGCVQIKMQ